MNPAARKAWRAALVDASGSGLNAMKVTVVGRVPHDLAQCRGGVAMAARARVDHERIPAVPGVESCVYPTVAGALGSCPRSIPFQPNSRSRSAGR